MGAAVLVFPPASSAVVPVVVRPRSGVVWHLLGDLDSWAFIMAWVYGWYVAYLAAVGKLTARADRGKTLPRDGAVSSPYDMTYDTRKFP